MADENNLEKVTYVSVITDDHGQFGSSYCGHCSYKLGKEDSGKCPDCGYILRGVIDDSRAMGGQSSYSR